MSGSSAESDARFRCFLSTDEHLAGCDGRFFACLSDIFVENYIAADMKITDGVLRSFRVARSFEENAQKVNCVDYSPSGEHAVSSSDDDGIILYDVTEGK